MQRFPNKSANVHVSFGTAHLSTKFKNHGTQILGEGKPLLRMFALSRSRVSLRGGVSVHDPYCRKSHLRALDPLGNPEIKSRSS